MVWQPANTTHGEQKTDYLLLKDEEFHYYCAKNSSTEIIMLM